MSKFFGFLRRSFFVAVTCVITVVSMAIAISPPVSAAGVFSPFNFYQLYQMLHGLLLGDGGGNSQTFGEWLEENMTRTVGSGNDKKEFLITPGMKLSDMMTQASLNLVLGAALSDGGIAGTSKIKDLIDSWTEVYDTSDIGEIGSSSGGILFPNSPSIFSLDGVVLFSGSDSYLLDSEFFWYRPKSGVIASVFLISDGSNLPSIYIASSRSDKFSFSAGSSGILSWRFSDGSISSDSAPVWSSEKYDQWGHVSSYGSYSDLLSSVKSFGVTHIFDSVSDALKFLNSHTISDFQQLVFDTNSDFVGPVYAMPAAKQLITDTGTLSGLRLDVQTEDGTPDISAALDHAGVDNVNDLVAGVAAGTIPMTQVYDDMRVVPYVLTDVDTGEIVTDLNVSATDAKTKAVALDMDLSIPKDISAADAYQITGKTWDPSLSKYKLPLFDFFPFCLPYDAYQFLTMLDVTPVAPVFQVDTTPLFSHTRFFHASDGYKITLDLTKYEEVFQILRAGECLAIVVGLCLISYKLIHGGD